MSVITEPGTVGAARGLHIEDPRRPACIKDPAKGGRPPGAKSKSPTEHPSPPIDHNGGPLADDLIIGGPALCEYIFGSRERSVIKRLYHLASRSIPPERRIPAFFIGVHLCGRKSTIVKWISDQERAGLGNAKEPADGG